MTEKEAISVLLEEGDLIKIKRRSILKFIQKEKVFTIKAPTLETLYRIARRVNELKLSSYEGENNKPLDIIADNIFILSDIIAIAIVGRRGIFSKLRERFISHYLMSHLSVSELEAIFEIIRKGNNLEGFISSIRLAVGLRSTTIPKNEILIE